MGMNTILMLIAGIVMSTMVASQVAPSIVEGVKVKKTQVQTINNQEVIFEAIKRYTTIKQVAPNNIEDLIDEKYIDTKVNDNGFGGKYTIDVNKALGVATITTTIVDPKAQEAFLNSFMGTSKPSYKVNEDGTWDTNKFETKYVLPNEIMHGNALLMTGIPIGPTPPDHNTNKYWYHTKDGKATLKLYDGTNWVEVNLGGSGDDSTNVKLTGDQTIDGIKTFTSFPITPSSNPTNDYQVANKKYVDSKIGHTQSLTQNGWVKLPNGLIMQWGRRNNVSSGAQATITFPINFTQVLNASVTRLSIAQSPTMYGFHINSLNNNSITIVNGSQMMDSCYWFAIGY